jgi:hypothetical protein
VKVRGEGVLEASGLGLREEEKMTREIEDQRSEREGTDRGRQYSI